MGRGEYMSEKLKIIFISHTYMGGTYVVGSHHLSTELLKMGHDVLHISTPISPLHLITKKMRELSKDRFLLWRKWKEFKTDEVKNIVPFSILPWRLVSNFFEKTGLNLMMHSISFPKINKIIDYYGFENPDLIFVDQPNLVGIEKKLNAKVKVYRATDLYTQMTEDNSIINAESKVVKNMDGLVGTSRPVLEHLNSLNAAVPSLLLENGVDYPHFNKETVEPDDLANIPHPRAVYIGAIDKRLDIDSLIDLAKARSDVSIVIIGLDTSNQTKKFDEVDNIYFLGKKSYEVIPEYLNHCDIGLLPLSSHESNQGRSPMKLYEYAAAGLAVVSRKYYELERRNENFIFLYNDSGEFVEKLLQAIEYKKTNNEIKLLVEKHSWSNKALELIQFAKQLNKAKY